MYYLRELTMHKWLYFIIILLAAVCICLVVLNVRTAKKSSSAAIELERSQKVMADLKKVPYPCPLFSSSCRMVLSS